MSQLSERGGADAVYEQLLLRQGERWVQPRVERTARVLDYLDNPQRSYRVVHITGTNGKSSTSRMIESLLRAQNLRTGLFTSPHLQHFTERMLVDGEPVSDAAVVSAWQEIEPFVALVDAELVANDDAPLTFFELLTILAFVIFADAPVDVLVLEVGMGGAWDSTNTADGDVAVFAPIAVDHVDRLGATAAEIAEVKSGIIKSGARVVSAAQLPEVLTVLRAAALDKDARLLLEGVDFELSDDVLAVGGQLLSIRGIAGNYPEVFLPLYGAHQGQNAAVAVAAVEALLGDGSRALNEDVVAQGLGEVTSPGRLQLIGINPTVFVDAAHNPHGVHALVAALRASFDFEEWAVVLGVLSDKDAAGIVAELAPFNPRVFVTSPDSDRAQDAEVLADQVEHAGLIVSVHPDLEDAARAARNWAVSAQKRAVAITGSVILAGEAISLADAEQWKADG